MMVPTLASQFPFIQAPLAFVDLLKAFYIEGMRFSKERPLQGLLRIANDSSGLLILKDRILTLIDQ